LSGGVSFSNNQKCASVKCVDNVGTSITSSNLVTTSCIQFINNSGVAIQDYSLQSGDGNTITLGRNNFNSTQAVSGWMGMIVLGGDDVVNAATTQSTVNSGHAIGNYALGSPNFFSGTMLMMIGCGISGTNGNMQTAYLEVGVATASGEQACIAVVSEQGAALADTKRWQRTDRIFGGYDSASNIISQMHFRGFTSGGIAVNWISGARNSTGVFAFLTVKISGNCKVINWNTISGTGNQNISGVGFSGKLALFMTNNTSCNNVNTPALDNNRLSIGSAVSSANECAVWAGDKDTPSTMASTRGTRNDACILAAVENATDSSTSGTLIADFTSFNANGFSLNKSVNAFNGDTSGMTIATLVIGDAIEVEVVSGVAQDITRRAFGGGRLEPSLMMGSQFGTFQNAETDNRPIFGQLYRPQGFVNTSGLLW
jgi:hypothetical protein